MISEIPSREKMSGRRGMVIKNVSGLPLTIRMSTRAIDLEAGEEVLLSADEVKDRGLREKLQVRAIAIVRPATAEETKETT